MLRKVIVENGAVEGLPAADPRITAFRGIPYAAPPVGAGRWRAPQPAKNWDGVRKAYTFAPISVQHVPGEDPNNIYSREWNVDPSIAMDEDCLYLNVWTPARTADEKLPVFVWYFGGGLQEGNTAEMEFDGERLARRGIVVVTVNYRLNVFGFLCHPEITAENPEFPANFGHLDQRFGTLWVKRNIAAFGGDPDNITIGGQSAGGGSVMTQVASPLNAGLFQRAIVDSGLELSPYPRRGFGGKLTLQQAEEKGKAFFEILGVKTLAEARALDAFHVRDKMLENKFMFASVIDDRLIPGNTNERYMFAEGNVMPMLFGHTATEFKVAPPAESIEELEAFARAQYGEDAQEYLRICASRTGAFAEMRHKATLSYLEYAVRLFGRVQAKTGKGAPFYYCRFNPEIPGWDNPGSFHSSDLWFFFETLAKCWRPFKGKHYDLARLMCNYWANFIKCGDPNGPDADGEDMPRWEAFTDAHPHRMRFEDVAYADEKAPSPLIEFLLRQAEKKYGV